ncbi:hypothetical protein [Actinomyces ruminicola]|uniref:hypothetical protein n=1 Tax=Actinomyces ruminicola TaxID=332524 RepID=UPI0011CB1655|nr:hypothetical protein [Actinomyces ruminicola]
MSTIRFHELQEGQHFVVLDNEGNPFIIKVNSISRHTLTCSVNDNSAAAIFHWVPWEERASFEDTYEDYKDRVEAQGGILDCACPYIQDGMTMHLIVSGMGNIVVPIHSVSEVIS